MSSVLYPTRSDQPTSALTWSTVSRSLWQSSKPELQSGQAQRGRQRPVLKDYHSKLSPLPFIFPWQIKSWTIRKNPSCGTTVFQWLPAMTFPPKAQEPQRHTQQHGYNPAPHRPLKEENIMTLHRLSKEFDETTRSAYLPDLQPTQAIVWLWWWSRLWRLRCALYNSFTNHVDNNVITNLWTPIAEREREREIEINW